MLPQVLAAYRYDIISQLHLATRGRMQVQPSGAM